jgi:hypothetical protein
MNDYDMQDRIHEILEGKIAMGGRLMRQPSSRLGDAASGIKYMDFVKEWHQVHPEYTWKEAVEMASHDYHKMKGEGLLIGGVLIGGDDDDFYEGGVGNQIGSLKGWEKRYRAQGDIKKANAIKRKIAALTKKPVVRRKKPIYISQSLKGCKEAREEAYGKPLTTAQAKKYYCSNQDSNYYKKCYKTQAGRRRECPLKRGRKKLKRAPMRKATGKKAENPFQKCRRLRSIYDQAPVSFVEASKYYCKDPYNVKNKGLCYTTISAKRRNCRSTGQKKR